MARVSSVFATWTTLLFLLAVHLLTNYLAVRAVTMNSLNRQRASILFSHLIDEGQVLTPQEVATHEHVFGRGAILHGIDGKAICSCDIGASLQELLRHTSLTPESQTQSSQKTPIEISPLLSLFKDEHYLLWHNRPTRTASITLKRGATPRDQLKAWLHALLLARDHASIADDDSERHKGDHSQRNLARLGTTKDAASKLLSEREAALEAAGWDLATAALETRPGVRVVAP